MSSALPPFLEPLELDPATDPDERALRRAYARRLKQIDVEAEPERFQALREALDQGLRWVAWRDQVRLAQASAPAPGPEPLPELAPRDTPAPDRAAEAAPPITDDQPPPADAPRVVPAPPRTVTLAAPGADELAAAVLARFQRHVDDGLKDAESTRSLLLRFLGDPDLVSLDGRASFELRVARMLAGNWRPGHEHLLDPAVEVFGWNSDHARLKHFGQLGAMLTAAIRERATVQAFTPAQRIALDALLARIRGGAAPDPAQLADEVPRLQYLVEHVPNWLRIVSPVDRVNERFRLWSERPPGLPLAVAPPHRAKRKPAPAWGVRVTYGVLAAGVLMLVTIVRMLVAGGPSPQPAQSPGRAAMAAKTSPADDADLARRQKEAEALLARVRQPGGAAR
jgi:protein TonB